MQQMDELFDRLARSCFEGLSDALRANPGLAMARSATGTTLLHEAARMGNGSAVEALIAAGAALDAVDGMGATPICRAAENGHADVVELLYALGADRHFDTGPGHWAYTANGGPRWDVLEITRDHPRVRAAWKSGGMPIERRDNYTMTEFRLIDVPTQLFALGTRDGITHGGYDAAEREILRDFANLDWREYRIGPSTTIYSRFTGTESTYTAAGTTFRLEIGFPVSSSPPESGAVAVSERAGFTALSVVLRGPLNQVGYAHWTLRDCARDRSLRDPARQLREVYHYFEHPQSDANVTEIQMEVDPPSSRPTPAATPLPLPERKGVLTSDTEFVPMSRPPSSQEGEAA